MKCDVIVPVYKAPEWVNLCIYAIFQNTDPKYLNKVILINDCDDPFTINCLKNIKKQYGGKIELLQNEQNLGFVKTVNRGFKASTADCVLLQNTDCIISKNTIGKLIAHIENDPKIGLICPLASNAANISLPIPEGFSYSQVDKVLEKHFLGQSFDACTVVGNCLMITRKCLEKVGNLDEAYGTGYGEETDYQFKAMKKGFKAKVAIDTYVFHKAEASFGTSKEKQERLAKNRDLFFSRWGEDYNKEFAKYQKNDPIEYVKANLPKDCWTPNVDTIFYLDGIVQNAGGVHIVVDLINYLSINGESANIVYNLQYPYKEIMLFTPLESTHTKNLKTKRVVSTIWKSTFDAKKIAEQKNAKLLSFIQGYEAYFENGTIYGSVETSYKLADSLIAVSSFLQKELKTVFNKESFVVPSGVNLNLLYDNFHKPQKTPTITFVLRNNVMKGDWLALDICKRLNSYKQPLLINLVSMNENIKMPTIDNPDIKFSVIKGPLTRTEIYQILQQSDLYVDTSLAEGFGLTALEAMAAGCVPIISNSGGVNEYFEDGKNGYLVKDSVNAEAYIKTITKALSDPQNLKTISKNGQKTATNFNFLQKIGAYIELFNTIDSKPSTSEPLTEKDLKICKSMHQERVGHSKKIRAFTIAKKITPKPIKYKAVSVIDKLYRYINNV